MDKEKTVDFLALWELWVGGGVGVFLYSKRTGFSGEGSTRSC